MKRTKKKTTKTKSSNRQHKIVWLYGPTQDMIERSAVAFINSNDPNFDVYRIRAGFGSDELFIPIWWNVRNRAERITELAELDVAHLLIIGHVDDLENEFMSSAFEFGSALFIVPTELEYHEATISEQTPLAWKEIIDLRDEFLKFFKENFKDWEEIQ